MGLVDTLSVIRFYLTIMFFGLAAFPISASIFPHTKSAGFILAKPIGILSVCLVVWELTYIRVFKFTYVIVLLVLLGLAASWFITALRKNVINTISRDGVLENILLEETIFAIALTTLCFFKGFLPQINGQEKFMDYGYMLSMLRNPQLPANDMWMAGKSINYYYFGQFIYALLTKISTVEPSVAYNISMCCSIALPFSMCISIGRMLIDSAREFGIKMPKYLSIIVGLFTGLAAMIFGNSHSFFYDPESIGNNFLEVFKNLGARVGDTSKFFYPDSTRYIGYNPDSSLIEGIKNGGDYTIEEFPFYSYLIGDLHAHVCSTMVVLLIFALAVALVYKIGSYPSNRNCSSNDFDIRFKFEFKNLIHPELIAIAVLLGVAQMTNYWDFLIYFIFGSMLLFVINTRTTKDFSTVTGAIVFGSGVIAILAIYLLTASHPLIHSILQTAIFVALLASSAQITCALTRTATGMSAFFAIASWIALPFNLNFDMMSNSLALSVNHSSIYQLYILWGTHVIINVAFLLFVITHKNTGLEANTSKHKAASKSRTATYDNPIQQFFGERNIMDVFVCGVIVVGILLLLFPEVFYVRDIYTGGYLRSNTMFKFTYAGFIMLSISMIYSIVRLMFMERNDKKGYSTSAFVLSIIFVVMLLVPAHYTLVSLEQRNGSLKKDNYITLDGTAYLENHASSYIPSDYNYGNMREYQACIDWFNNEVDGSPVIMEAHGLSYTDYNMISAYTGLPTVCGWQTHEWLWRFHGVVDPETNILVSDPNNDVWELYLTPRYNDIDTVYTSTDAEEIRDILDFYNVEYVIIGDLEFEKYGVDNTGIIASLGEIAFNQDNLFVIKINR
ncbi:MAG: DUF2298 domain-containing protein [Saccharofermentans sp.]|nr:DUF2298 domain-containing protein [Saccharofermentans sp.]